VNLKRLHVFVKLSQRNTSLKGQVDAVPDASLITIYARNIESIDDARQTLAHELTHVLHPDWDEERVEVESVNLKNSQPFKEWLCQKAREYESLAMLFRAMSES
jgi:hypothetical protein